MRRTRIGVALVAVGVILLVVAGLQAATTSPNAGLGGFAFLYAGMAGLALLALGGIIWALSSR